MPRFKRTVRLPQLHVGGADRQRANVSDSERAGGGGGGDVSHPRPHHHNHRPHPPPQTARVVAQYGLLYRPEPELTDPPDSDAACLTACASAAASASAAPRTHQQHHQKCGAAAGQGNWSSDVVGEDGVVTAWPSSAAGAKPRLLVHLERRIHTQLALMHRAQGQDRETLAVHRGDLLRECLVVLGRHFRVYRHVFETLADFADGLLALFDAHRAEILSVNAALKAKQRELEELRAAHEGELRTCEERGAEARRRAQLFAAADEDRKVVESLCDALQQQLQRQQQQQAAMHERLERLSTQHATMTIREERQRQLRERLEKEKEEAAQEREVLSRRCSALQMKLELLEVERFRLERQRAQLEGELGQSTGVVRRLQEELRLLRADRHHQQQPHQQQHWRHAATRGDSTSTASLGSPRRTSLCPPSRGGAVLAVAAANSAEATRHPAGADEPLTLTPRPNWLVAEAEEPALRTLDDTSSIARVTQLVRCLSMWKTRATELEHDTARLREQILVLEEANHLAPHSALRPFADPPNQGAAVGGGVTTKGGRSGGGGWAMAMFGGLAVPHKAFVPCSAEGCGDTCGEEEREEGRCRASNSSHGPSNTDVPIPVFLRAPVGRHPIALFQFALPALLANIEHIFEFVAKRYDDAARRDACSETGRVEGGATFQFYRGASFADELHAWVGHVLPLPAGVADEDAAVAAAAAEMHARQLSLAYSLVFAAQQAPCTAHPLVRFFLAHLAGEVAKDAFLGLWRQLRVVRTALENVDAACSGFVDVDRAVAAIARECPHHASHELKLLETVLRRCAVAQGGQPGSREAALWRRSGEQQAPGAPREAVGAAGVAAPTVVHYPPLFAPAHAFAATLCSIFLCATLHTRQCITAALCSAPRAAAAHPAGREQASGSSGDDGSCADDGGGSLTFQVALNALRLADPAASLEELREYVHAAFFVPHSAPPLPPRATVSVAELLERLQAMHHCRRTPINAGIIKFSSLPPPALPLLQVEAAPGGSGSPAVEDTSSGSGQRSAKLQKMPKPVRAMGARRSIGRAVPGVPEQ